MQFHERIKALREDKDLKQEEIGKLLDMSQVKISRLELKITNPTPEEIIKFCKLYNVSADYILGISDSKK